MQLSFPADKSVDLAFKVGIAGTQTSPTTVTVVLERDGKMLSYAALPRGDEWVAKIENPGSVFKFGEVKLVVNVVIGGRIITPLKSIATIVGDTSDASEVKHEVEPMTIDVPKDAPDEVPHAEIVLPAFEAQPEAAVEQVVPTPEPVVVKPAQTEAEKKQKVQDLLDRARAKIKKEAALPIRMGLLKSVDVAPAQVKEAAPKSKKKIKSADVFSIKKTSIRVI
jgi:hypothetical protein